MVSNILPMKKKIRIAIFFVLLGTHIIAQWFQQARDSINRLSYADHQLMMKQLGIKELRPGPSGNPGAPNAANTDEALATAYTHLPDPLVFNNGEKVTGPEDWRSRRLEILEDFDREIYGRVPDHVPSSVSWELVGEKDTVNGTYPVKIKELVGHADNASFPGISVDIQLTLTTPAGVDEPVPRLSWNSGLISRPDGEEGPSRKGLPGNSSCWNRGGGLPSWYLPVTRQTTAPASGKGLSD